MLVRFISSMPTAMLNALLKPYRELVVGLEFKPKSVSNQYFCTLVFANLKGKGGLVELEKRFKKKCILRK